MLISSSPDLTVNDLLRGDIQLTSPPSVYFALKNIVDDPTKTVRDAAVVIETDAALACRLLKIVNSSFYGFPAQIDSLSKAVSLIGSRELQNLTLAAVVIERFSELPGQQFSMHDFWSRSLRCALIARELDALLGKNHAETAFLCGLLHNIGHLVIYRRMPVLAREVDLLLQSQIPPSHDEAPIERQIFGFDHFDVGTELCRLWKLPEHIIDSIRLHNYPDYVGHNAEIATVARLANHYSRVDTPYDAIVADGLAVPSQHIGAILDKVHNEFEILFKLFYPG